MSEATVTSPVTNLSPGFRFHPTDEELVCYFLKRKVCHKKFQLDVIAEIDIYKFEPWDLPGLITLFFLFCFTSVVVKEVQMGIIENEDGFQKK